MRISLEKRGGLAAVIIARLPPRSLESAALPAADAAELERLVAAARAAPAAESAGSGVPADMMSYAITVEDGSGRAVLRATDVTMSAAFRALLRFLEQHLAAR
jgi:hypothetical protein